MNKLAGESNARVRGTHSQKFSLQDVYTVNVLWR